MALTSGKPCFFFSHFFHFPQVQKVTVPESIAYLKKEIPSTFWVTFYLYFTFFLLVVAKYTFFLLVAKHLNYTFRTCLPTHTNQDQTHSTELGKQVTIWVCSTINGVD